MKHNAAHIPHPPTPDVFDLSEQSQAVARTFDGIGENLGACHAGIGQIIAEAANIAGALHDDELDRALAGSDPIFDHCRSLLADFRQEGQLLDALSQTILATRGPVDALAKMIRMIHMVSVNARIVSAGIATHEDLGVFTVDLGELIRDMDEVVSHFTNLNEALAKKVEAQTVQHRQFMGNQGFGLNRTLESLPAELARLDAVGEDAEQLRRRLSESTTILQRSLSRVVPLLQVGDATRQRLEHITNLSDILPGMVKSAPAGLALTAHLRAGLLEGTIAQLTADVDFALSELEVISDQVSRVMQQANDRRGNGTLDEVARLNSVVEEMLALLRECEIGRERSSALRDETRASLNDLGHCMIKLGNVVHAAGMVSLNAAISCARLGRKAAPLAVVAVQVRELNQDIDALCAQIGHIISQTQSQFALSDNDRSASADAFGSFRQHFSTALHRLEETGVRIGKLEESLAIEAAEIETRLKSMQRHAGGVELILQDLTARTHMQLPNILDNPWLTSACFESARASLTMQAERDIFDAILASGITPGAGQQLPLLHPFA